MVPQKGTPTNQPTPFACNCYSINDTYKSAVLYCDNGNTAHIYQSKWFGDPSPVNNDNKTDYCNRIDYKPNSSEVTCHVDPPMNVVIVNRKAAFADCVLDFCKEVEMETWTESDGICSENRQGPLCGECKDGYAVTPSSLVRCFVTHKCLLLIHKCMLLQHCVKCQDQQGLIIFFTFFFGLVIALAIILLNITISPLGAALLFFTQVSMIIKSRIK